MDMMSAEIKKWPASSEFFSGVFTREDTDNIPEPHQMNFESEISSVQVTVRKVKDKIRKLRRGAAAGPARTI